MKALGIAITDKFLIKIFHFRIKREGIHIKRMEPCSYAKAKLCFRCADPFFKLNFFQFLSHSFSRQIRLNIRQNGQVIPHDLFGQSTKNIEIHAYYCIPHNAFVAATSLSPCARFRLSTILRM